MIHGYTEIAAMQKCQNRFELIFKIDMLDTILLNLCIEIEIEIEIE